MGANPETASAEVLTILERELLVSVRGLLEAYGLDTIDTDNLDGSFELASSIGFAGHKIAGSLSVATLAAVANAMGQTDGSLRANADWIGELANQTLGRLKNRLLRYGVDLSMGTPVIVNGIDLRIHPLGNSSIAKKIGTSSGPFLVCLDIRAADAVETSAPASSMPIAAEGELLLF